MRNEKLNDSLFAFEYFDQISGAVRLLYRHLDFYRPHRWRWMSDKGLFLLLDIESAFDKKLIRFALERLEINKKNTSSKSSFLPNGGIFYLLPEPKSHLQEKVNELKALIVKQTEKHCLGCGGLIDGLKKYCTDCAEKRNAESRKRYAEKIRKVKVCPICGTAFNPYGKQKYCSENCKKETNRRKQRQRYLRMKEKNNA